MYFRHADAVWTRFPSLAALVFTLRGARAVMPGEVRPRTDALLDRVATAQAAIAEADRPSIQAWRHAYAAMGLKPTQYRSAVEALLRRYRKDGTVPDLHPLVNLLNAYSMDAGLPIAAFDVAHVVGGIEVRPARGDETFETFGGEAEQPNAGEIVFADAANVAHARRWVFRQGATSSVTAASDRLLVVIEGLHAGAGDDLIALRDRLLPALTALGAQVDPPVLLTPDHRTYTFDGATSALTDVATA